MIRVLNYFMLCFLFFKVMVIVIIVFINYNFVIEIIDVIDGCYIKHNLDY